VSHTFRSLRYPNARLFFSGLALSNIGTWIQFTALAILVDRLTGKTTAIGVMTALQFAPMLVFGAWAGAITDRVDRLTMTKITQGLLAVEGIALAVCDVTGVINIPIIYALTFLLGMVSAFDNPARRGVVTELVPPDQIPNAVSLNTAVMTGSRIFGPAITAVLIGPLGTGWLFVLNALSFGAILASLFLIRRGEMYPPPRAPRGGTPIRDGLRFIRGTPVLLATFVAFTVWSTFGFNYNVSLPRIADEIWGAEHWFGWVLTAISVGSLLGSLLTASRQWVSLRWLIGMAVLMCAGNFALAWSGEPWLAMLVAVPLGVGGAGVVSAFNAISQQECPPDMRGRILALSAVAFLGSYPIGGPITGIVGDQVGLEWSIAYGGVLSSITVLGLVWWALGRHPEQSRVAVLRSLLGTTEPVAPSPNDR
jgi:MFS family permease